MVCDTESKYDGTADFALSCSSKDYASTQARYVAMSFEMKGTAQSPFAQTNMVLALIQHFNGTGGDFFKHISKLD